MYLGFTNLYIDTIEVVAYFKIVCGVYMQHNFNVNWAQTCVNDKNKLFSHSMFFIADAGFEHIFCPYEDGTFKKPIYLGDSLHKNTLNGKCVECSECRLGVYGGTDCSIFSK